MKAILASTLTALCAIGLTCALFCLQQLTIGHYVLNSWPAVSGQADLSAKKLPGEEGFFSKLIASGAGNQVCFSDRTGVALSVTLSQNPGSDQFALEDGRASHCVKLAHRASELIIHLSTTGEFPLEWEQKVSQSGLAVFSSEIPIPQPPDAYLLFVENNSKIAITEEVIDGKRFPFQIPADKIRYALGLFRSADEPAIVLSGQGASWEFKKAPIVKVDDLKEIVLKVGD